MATQAYICSIPKDLNQNKTDILTRHYYRHHNIATTIASMCVFRKLYKFTERSNCKIAHTYVGISATAVIGSEN